MKLYNGKYEIVLNKDGLPVKCLRNGDNWRDLIGDNMVHALITRIQDAEGTLQLIADLAVDYDGNRLSGQLMELIDELKKISLDALEGKYIYEGECE